MRWSNATPGSAWRPCASVPARGSPRSSSAFDRKNGPRTAYADFVTWIHAARKKRTTESKRAQRKDDTEKRESGKKRGSIGKPLPLPALCFFTFPPPRCCLLSVLSVTLWFVSFLPRQSAL